jgi:hypothetical protein
VRTSSVVTIWPYFISTICRRPTFSKKQIRRESAVVSAEIEICRLSNIKPVFKKLAYHRRFERRALDQGVEAVRVASIGPNCLLSLGAPPTFTPTSKRLWISTAVAPRTLTVS